ncbi:MAG TPA: hypothetical protein VJB11_02100 [archaeon]|nr:hypothetical protein [archaeon]
MNDSKQFAIISLIVILVVLLGINQMLIANASKITIITGQVTAGATNQATQQIQQPFLGTQTEYGVAFTQEGYNQLLNDEKTIKLDSEQLKSYVGLDVLLPQCCAFQFLQASGNCECGHHLALSGLAKRMITKGYDKQNVQKEIDKWKEFFYPSGASASTGNMGSC